LIALASVNIALNLEFFTSNSVSFVPVYLGQPYFAAFQSDAGYALTLSPSTPAIELPQARKLSDGRPSGKGLDMRDVSDDLKVHQASMLPSNVRGHRADEMKDATACAASEAPGGPRG
jgi:hypothetical protein